MRLGTITKSFLAAALLAALAASPAGATNGMDMIGYGPRSIGMGGADVAMDGDASSVGGGNPAVVTGAAPSSAAVAATALMPVLTYQDPMQTVDGKKQLFLMPSVGYVHSFAGTPWAAGIGLYAQGGMGVDFQKVAPGPGAPGDEITSQVAFARVNPLVAYRVNEALSLGASVMLGYTSARFSLFPATPSASTGLEVKDLYSFGYAGKIGAQLKMGEMVRLGATYSTEAKIDLANGTASVNMGPGGIVKYDAELNDFTWPQELEAGIAFLPTKDLTLAADVKWINWSATVDKPLLKLSAPNQPVPPGYEALEMPFDMGWKDQWVYAVGAEWRVNPKHTLRAGFNVANNPVPAAKLNPLFPAIPTTHATVGYSLNLGKWSLDLAYEHAFEKTQKSSNPAMPIEIAHSQNTVSAGATYRY